MPRAERTSGKRTDRRQGGRRAAQPPTVVLLVRHGATATTGKLLPGRAPGLHLADAGVAQAEVVAARIVALTSSDGRSQPDADAQSTGRGRAARGAGRGRARSPRSAPAARGIAAVYSSPLERTRETAAAIAGAAGCDVRIDDGLTELDTGEWTGIQLEAARKRPEWATIQRYPSGFAFPGGESFVDMQARIVACLERLRTRHAGETIVAVSHADPIRAAVAHAMGSHLDLFQRVVISPCSLTGIAYGEAGPIVLTVNATGDERALVPA
jgi:probable phosphoglycerate mutase